MQDVFLDVRRHIAMGSLAACGIFHASLEDNLACATPDAVTQTEAREAAEAVGLHEWAQNLPVGCRIPVPLHDVLNDCKP
jgi:ABC-type multidrug transport system fused ATPase/permease subunit